MTARQMCCKRTPWVAPSMEPGPCPNPATPYIHTVSGTAAGSFCADHAAGFGSCLSQSIQGTEATAPEAVLTLSDGTEYVMVDSGYTAPPPKPRPTGCTHASRCHFERAPDKDIDLGPAYRCVHCKQVWWDEKATPTGGEKKNHHA